MATLIPLADVAADAVECLLDAAFAPDRHRRTAYRLRDGSEWLPALSFAVFDDGDRLVGSIQCWPVALNEPESEPQRRDRPAARAHPLIMVGPVAVLPGDQGRGFGKALMAASLAALDPRAPLPQVLIGDAGYYGQWGFAPTHTGGWLLPGPWDPARLLARCDVPAVLPRAGMLGPWRG